MADRTSLQLIGYLMAGMTACVMLVATVLVVRAAGTASGPASEAALIQTVGYAPD